MNHLIPSRLSLLIAVSECGSLTAAADRLGLTQPALSYRLSKLEDALGSDLFNRTGRRLSLNAAGERALHTAQSIARDVQRLQDDLNSLAGQSTECLRLAAHCFTTYRWLPDVTRRLRHRFPNLDVQVNVDATRTPQAFLDRREVELVLTAYPNSFNEYQTKFLFEDELFALVSRDHLLAGKGEVTPADLSGENVLVYSAQGSPVIDEFMQPAGCSPRLLSEMPLTEGMIEMARAGLGVAVLAGWVMKRHEKTGMVRLRLGQAGMKRRWHAVYHASNDNPVLHAVIDELRDYPRED